MWPVPVLLVLSAIQLIYFYWITSFMRRILFKTYIHFQYSIHSKDLLLEIKNFILDIFRDVVSAYITGFLELSYIEKLISNVGHFLITFCWLIWVQCRIILGIWIMQNVSDMSRRLSIVYIWSLLVFSFMESSILTIFYIFSFCLVFNLYKSSLKILQFISGHLIFLGSADIGGYLIVALFERWILTLAHFSDVFFWSVNCTCQTCISSHVLGMGMGF